MQVALIVYTLLHRPFITTESLARVLQGTESGAAEALEMTMRCMVNGQSLVRPNKNTWLLSETARRLVLEGGDVREFLKRLRVLWYVAPEPSEASTIVDEWLSSHERISSGDYAAITGLTTAGARGTLDRLVDEGYLKRGEAAGRNAHYLAGDRGRSGI